MRDSVWKKLFYKDGLIYSHLYNLLLKFYNNKYNFFDVLNDQINNSRKQINNSKNFVNQIINYLFKNINTGFFISSGEINNEFKKFVDKKLRISIYKYIKNTIIEKSEQLIKDFLNSVKKNAKNYVKIPNFKSIHINLGSGGNTVYELSYDRNNIRYYRRI
ncbi:MAG: hypothetical protein ACTSWY_09955 [Promethearchaeota archaeon]